LVSTARMFFLYVLPHAFVELLQLFHSGFFLRKDRAVNVFRRIPAGFANDNGIPFLVPFQNGARADAEFSPHFRWNRNLPLSGNFRLCQRHALTLPR